MKKIFGNLFLVAVAVTVFASCENKERNTEELIDPWLRERTPVNVRLESQVGPAIISQDWRNDETGSVAVSLVTSKLDLSAVKVEALDFKYPESEYCPTASIKPGDTVDLTDGSAEFVVTSKNGETRTYTITYSVFTDTLEGSYSFTTVGGLLDTSGAVPYASLVMIGGFEGWITYCQVMDKYWIWAADYNPRHEDDNTLSFQLTDVDDQTGETFGTIINTPGPDGKYANYIFKTYDINEQYRLIPADRSRWAKHGDGYITIYAYDDEKYEKPLHKLELLEKGEHKFWSEAVQAEGGSAEKIVNVPELALHRSFGPGPFNNETSNWGDERWYANNIRNVFWLIRKDSDSPIEGHKEYFEK